MRRSQVYVLRSSHSVTLHILDHLFDEAIQLAKSNVESGRMHCEWDDDPCIAEVHRVGRHACIGSVSGELYEATIECNRGSIKMTFVARETDLEDATMIFMREHSRKSSSNPERQYVN